MAVDQALAEQAASHGEYLAGLTARAMLDVVGQPTKLPTLLFPDLPRPTSTASGSKPSRSATASAES